jgi:hypothetical protein
MEKGKKKKQWIYFESNTSNHTFSLARVEISLPKDIASVTFVVSKMHMKL